MTIKNVFCKIMNKVTRILDIFMVIFSVCCGIFSLIASANFLFVFIFLDEIIVNYGIPDNAIKIPMLYLFMSILCFGAFLFFISTPYLLYKNMGWKTFLKAIIHKIRTKIGFIGRLYLYLTCAFMSVLSFVLGIASLYIFSFGIPLTYVDLPAFMLNPYFYLLESILMFILSQFFLVSIYMLYKDITSYKAFYKSVFSKILRTVSKKIRIFINTKKYEQLGIVYYVWGVLCYLYVIFQLVYNTVFYSVEFFANINLIITVLLILVVPMLFSVVLSIFQLFKEKLSYSR